MTDHKIQYAIDRDTAITECLLTNSVEPFKDFLNIYKSAGVLPKCFETIPDNVLEITIRKMSLHCNDIPTELKGQAVEWLLNRGYDLDLHN